MKVAIIGAGNGGQAVAACLSLQNHTIFLYDRNAELIDLLTKQGGIQAEGLINGFGKVTLFTNNLQEAISDAQIIMITTTANAHAELAHRMAFYLRENQIVVLNPGRTGGALEFKEVLRNRNITVHIYIAEAQTLVYACRLIEPGRVNIIGIKERVFLATLPSSDIQFVLAKIQDLYTCFLSANNVLYTSFENIGAIFHPSVVLFNAAAIERGTSFYFYRDMTPSIADFIESLDEERLALGKAYGINLISAKDWVAFAYNNIEGDTLCERMKNNPAYYDILAPTLINSRQLLEDIPTGFVPLLEFGRLAGVKMPLFESILPICSTLLKTDLYKMGRTLDKLGLSGCEVQNVLKMVE
jgi:opine dehydrogenase